MLKTNSLQWYVCKKCGQKVCLQFGTKTPALIRHIGEHHDNLRDKYWDLPIPQMVEECFELRGFNE